MKMPFRDLFLTAAAFGAVCLSSATTFAQDISASAYIVIDHHSGHVLKEFNANKKLQVASLTKIATAVVVLDWANASGQNLDQLATVPTLRPEVSNGQGIQWLPGDRASLKDLLYAALLQSDNVAAETLASHVGRALSGGNDAELHSVSFISQMNALARKLNMLNTRFLNPHGLETLERKLPYSTAEDIAKLSAYAMSNPAFLFIVSQRERKITVQRADSSKLDYKLVNTNKLVGKSSIDGIKTGTTKRAGECLAISAARSPEVRKDGETFFITPRRLEIVVLGSTNRFPEAEALLQEGWSEHESWVAAGRPETPRNQRSALLGF
jgi:D-alanyl-D-alanine carboxypeptidase (penicillin-binding protein 5/6)